MEYADSLDWSIDRFMSHFREKCHQIAMVRSKKDENLFKKVLYVTVLDTLSKVPSPTAEGPRDRYTRFLRDFAEWGNWSRVGLPHLARLLEGASDERFSEAKSFISCLVQEWPDPSVGGPLSIERDPEYALVLEHWPKDSSGQPEKANGVPPIRLGHAHLFYSYRCTLIHELREPGYSIEEEDDDEPCYGTCEVMGTKQITWELGYPIRFIEGLCRRSIENLSLYCRERRISPHSRFRFGSYWIEELNTEDQDAEEDESDASQRHGKERNGEEEHPPDNE